MTNVHVNGQSSVSLSHLILHINYGTTGGLVGRDTEEELKIYNTSNIIVSSCRNCHLNSGDFTVKKNLKMCIILCSLK